MCLFLNQERLQIHCSIRFVQKNNVKTCAVVNVVESSIARDADLVLPIHCGPEVVLHLTKAFLGQMLVLYIMY